MEIVNTEKINLEATEKNGDLMIVELDDRLEFSIVPVLSTFPSETKGGGGGGGGSGCGCGCGCGCAATA